MTREYHPYGYDTLRKTKERKVPLKGWSAPIRRFSKKEDAVAAQKKMESRLGRMGYKYRVVKLKPSLKLSGKGRIPKKYRGFAAMMKRFEERNRFALIEKPITLRRMKA